MDEPSWDVPTKPSRKQVPLRLRSGLYEEVGTRAAAQGISTNALICTILESSLQPGGALIEKDAAIRAVTQTFDYWVSIYGPRVEARYVRDDIINRIRESGNAVKQKTVTTP